MAGGAAEIFAWLTLDSHLTVLAPLGAAHESFDEARLMVGAARPAFEPRPIAFGQSLSFDHRDAILLRAPFFWPGNHETIRQVAGIYSGSIAIIEAAAAQTLKARTVPRGLRPAAASRYACLRSLVDPLHLPPLRRELPLSRVPQFRPKLVGLRDDLPSVLGIEHLGAGYDGADVIEQTVELNATIHVASTR
jgi:hypothetical protein